MFKLLSVLQRLFALVLLLLFAALMAVAIYGYRHQDQILQKLVQGANKRLYTSIQIRSTQFTGLSSFPNLTFTLQEVAIKDPTQAQAWLAARRVHCAFDLWKILQGQYVLEQLTLEQGQLDLTMLRGYLVGEGTGTTTSQKSALTVDLQKLVFKDMDIAYGTQAGRLILHADYLQARPQPTHPQLKIDLNGQVTLHSLQHQTLHWQPQLPLKLCATLLYDQNRQAILLQPVKVRQGHAQIVAQGSWSLSGIPRGQLRIRGKHIALQDLAPYLPTPPPFSQLQGQLSFDMQLQKPAGAEQPAALQGSFSLQNSAWATQYLTHPIQLQAVHGALHMANLQDLTTGRLEVGQIRGSLAENQLVGSFSLSDFQKCCLQCTVHGEVDLAALNPFLVQAPVTDMAGKLMLDGTFQTSLRRPAQAQATPSTAQLTGTLKLQQGQCKLPASQLVWQDLNGHLVLQNQALAIKALTGRIGPSSFQLNGAIQRLGALWGCESAPADAKAKLYVDYLDLDTLLGAGAGAVDEMPWSTLPCRSLHLECDIQQLHYRRFQGKNIRGKWHLRGNKLVAEQLRWGMAGGKVVLDSTIELGVDKRNLHTTAKLRGVDLGRLFYMFENFHQRFLLDKHLRGKVFADCEWTLQLGERWQANWETLQAGIEVQLRNGVLHDFPPLQQLAAYVPKESLAEVHFPALKNHISIQQSTIHIPNMEAHSNVTRLQLSGSHTFDGKIDYNFVVPLSGSQLLPRGTMAADDLAGLNLHLRLHGDVNNYRVTYDTQALAESLQGNLKEQGKILKQILQGKYRSKNKIQELAPDDYFDFD